MYPLLNEFRKQCVGPYRAPPAPRIGPDYLAVVPAPAPASSACDAAAAARAAAGDFFILPQIRGDGERSALIHDVVGYPAAVG